MKREFRKLYSWLTIAVMMLSMLVMQIPLAKPVYAATEQNTYSTSLTKVLNYYQSNNYGNATTWWDMVGLWGAGNGTKTNWNSSKTSLAGNILGSLAKGEDPSNTSDGSNLLAELKATQESSTGIFPG
ncbi:MAG: hypothetical protein P4L69_17275, partial [Desulfosporosinus sp.]|nr:hypothetical protein [Desulfosporosinus sp.]